MNHLRNVGAALIAAFLISCSAFAQSPGAVNTNLSIWLKANTGAEEAVGNPAESGDALTRWLDQSPNGLHYIPAAGPTLLDDALNFNPAVQILSGGFDAPAGSELSADWTVITISRKLASDFDGRVFDGHAGNFLWSHWNVYTNSLYLNANPSNHNTGIATTSGVVNLHLHTYTRLSATGALEARADGTTLTTFGSSNSAVGVRIDIGNGAFAAESSDAQIGEMIIYSRVLTPAELLRVESYLAVKYGMTISHDYVTSAGATIWNLTANSGFNHDIAGIGADAATGLDQRKSQSINAGSWISMDKGGVFPVNNSYLMWGDNNATGGSTNVPASQSARSARIWKTAVTGTPGNVSFSIDLSLTGLANTGNSADYSLLIDNDTDFSTGATVHTTGANLVGNTLTFTNVALNNNQFFSVAVSNLNTPGGVPVGLATWLKSDGDVWEAASDPAESGDAITTWRDMSGHNNDYISVAGPTLQGSTLNFNPSVEILSGGFDAPVGSELGTEWTTFFVSRKLASDVTGRVFEGHAGNYLWAWWDNYTNSLFLNANPSNHNSGIATTAGLTNLHLHAYKRSVSGSVEARADGTSLATFGASNSVSGVRIDIENGAFAGESSDARIGEMIVYNIPLSATEVHKVESYLGIKYGITLAHDYIASDATVLWNVTANAGYNADITGIGRDDVSKLSQTKSTTINSSSDITFDKGGALGIDKSFLMWGNNAATGVTLNVPTTHKIRTSKIWKVAVTGTPGAVSFTADLSAIGLPVTGNASDYALLIDTDTDFSAGATTHIAGASLVGNVLSFTGVGLNNNNFISIAVANLSFPGGIPGLSFWVKGDAGVSGTTDVSQWADQSGYSNHAVQGVVGNQPGLVTNNINFNPSINFSGATDIFNLTNPQANLNTTVFTVGAPAVNSQWRTMFRGATGDHALIVETGAVRLGYFDGDNVGFKPSGFNWLQNEVAVVGLEMRTGDVNFRKNGAQGASINSINLANLQLNFFGNYQGNGQQFGRIAETVIYNGSTPLSTTEKEKIESYLAIKYGVTLAHNYLTTDGTVIWDATTNAAYNNNVAGIGRDDNSALDQRKSISSNTGTGLTIDKGSALSSDKDFLVWGSDGTVGTSFNVPVGYTLRSRLWKAAVTGTPGTVTLSIDLASVNVPNTGNTADYVLMKDTDADLSSGATLHTTGVSIVGNILSFTNVSFAHNDFFAIAVANVALPGGVAGGVFWVKGETGIVGATDVSQWNDQSGFSNHAVQPTPANQPTPVANNINFRTVVNFSASADFMTLSTPPPSLNSTIFAVGAPTVNSTWRTMFRGSVNDHPVLVETGTTNVGYYDADNGLFRPSGFTWAQNEVALISTELRAGDVNFRKNGTQGSSIGTINLATLDMYAFGNTQVGTQPFGRIAEVIMYNTASAITATDKEKIESYLGIKYGITLSHDYLSGNGSVLWNVTANSTYNNNITGVGRDDNTTLNQTRSLSVHANASVILETAGAIGSTNSYVLFGNDLGTGTSANVPAGFALRSGRIWKAGVTGTPGSVTVSFDLFALGLPNNGTAADFAILIDNDTDFSSGATAHTTGATLVGSTLTFTNLALSNNNFFTLAATNVVLPGGLFGGAFWVKGDVGVTGTTDVSQWNDQTGNSRHAVQPTLALQPTLVTNNINSHSVIDFNTATDIFNITSPPANLNSTAFIVGVPKINTTWRTFLRSATGDHQMLIEAGGTQVGYFDPDGGNFRTGGFTWLQNETAIVAIEMRAGDVNYRKNGAQGSSINTINLTGQALTWLGNYSGGNQAPGRIAETIIFNTASAIPDADKQKVESYLAVKYGITLAHNYVTTAGTVVWNTTTNALYNNEVAGIGRDDATGLDQRRSISVNNGAVVTMDLGGAFSVDRSYLIWGNNTGAMNATGVTDLPTGVIARLARVWKTAKSGTVGGVTVQFNLNTVVGSKTAADLRLLVDRNLDGLFADETAGGGGVISGATDLGGGLFTFTGVALNDGELFTVGSVSVSTPLPVTLTSFHAKATDAGVRVDWKTESEINNDHFTIEKSRDGAEFLDVGSVPAAGSSHTPKFYEFLDVSPFAGRSYYRLRQVDFDGRQTISKVAMVEYVPASTVYPNPATKEVSLDVDDREPFAAEMVNTLGQKVFVKQTVTNGRVTWNVESLPRGIYFITILKNGLMTTQKLILAD
ncbi:MAG TPA: T9SS type A sorting domain-containing protein [Cyclobacteriaceae bacterium]|nr:T9SS type A sorting domain-containing protein [Cyclobacteriaceae bacterium]